MAGPPRRPHRPHHRRRQRHWPWHRPSLCRARRDRHRRRHQPRRRGKRLSPMIGGNSARAEALDVTDRAACDALAAEGARPRSAALSILVNNAGIVRRATLDTGQCARRLGRHHRHQRQRRLQLHLCLSGAAEVDQRPDHFHRLHPELCAHAELCRLHHIQARREGLYRSAGQRARSAWCARQRHRPRPDPHAYQ